MNIDKPCHNSSCEPTATGRRSKKRSRIYRMRTESLTTDSFFDFLFLILIVPWQDKGILDGFCKWRHLLSLGQYMYAK